MRSTLKKLLIGLLLLSLSVTAHAQTYVPSGTSVLPFTPSNLAAFANSAALLLPHWRKALANVRSGNGNARVLMIGDSTTLGAGSNGSSSGNWEPLCQAQQLSNQLNARYGLNSSAASFMGTGGTNVDYNGAHNGLLSVGSGWAPTANYTVGGSYYFASAATSNLAFTPNLAVDTFIVYYAQGSGFGTFSYNINGGTPTNVNTNGSSATGSVTVSATRGINTINLNWVSGASGVYIIGVVAYDSTSKNVQVINGGWYGSNTTNWTTNPGTPYGPMGAAAALAPDLTIINLGINSWEGGPAESLTTFKTNMQTIITNALLTGDVLLVAPNPSNPASGTSQSVQQTYVVAIASLANANAHTAYSDVFDRWVSYSVSNPLGLYFDSLHPNGLGYSDMSISLANMIGAP